MCRLSAMTAVKLPVGMRRLFMNQLMLASVADDDQAYGAGLCDGVQYMKSKHSWFDHGLRWLQDLQNDAVWMGHVRKPSRNTSLSLYESHPFAFDLNDGRMFAQHNGTIHGTGESGPDEPNVDSYRAFKRLVPMINDAGALTPGVVNDWAAQFGAFSEWTFMMMFDPQRLYILRGQRPMHYMTIADGFMFNTSFDVLWNVKEWVNEFWPDYRLGKIHQIAEFQMVVADRGSTKLELTALNKITLPKDPAEGKYVTYRDGQQVLRVL